MTTISVPGPRARDGRTTSMPAYLSRPVATGRDPGPWPGVVLLHDAFGMSDDMRDQADWLAAAGYVALLPDLYSRDGRTLGWGRAPCVVRTVQQVQRGEGPAFARIEAARAALAAREDCTGVVGVVGFCMGGGFALLLASRPGWSAASVNYGVMTDDDAELARVVEGACPVVGSFGADDRMLPGAAGRLASALERAGVPHDVREYEGAVHGFVTRTADTSPLVPVLRRVMGVAHDHEASADARRRILAFFDEHLRGTPAGTDAQDGTQDGAGTQDGSEGAGARGGAGPSGAAGDEPGSRREAAPVGWVPRAAGATSTVG